MQHRMPPQSPRQSNDRMAALEAENKAMRQSMAEMQQSAAATQALMSAMQQSVAATQRSINDMQQSMSKRDTLLVQLEKERKEGLSFRVAGLEAHVSEMDAARADMRGMFNTLASAHLVNPGPQIYTPDDTTADDTTSIPARSTSAVPPTGPPPSLLGPPFGGFIIRRNPPKENIIARLHQMMKNADLEKTTVRNIMIQIEADLQITLSEDRKQMIRDEVEKFLKSGALLPSTVSPASSALSS
jgi:hypothetical protein